MIEVAFALHDKNSAYSKNVATAMASVFENTKKTVRIHLLHDDTLSDDNQSLFKRLCNDYSQEIYFHKIDNKEKFDSQRFSSATFFRLYLPNILPKDIHRVLYLDADICVNLDIANLWDINLNGKSLGAVKNWAECSEELIICKRVGIDEAWYFNAGVLLMDLDKIRSKHDLPQETYLFLREHPYADLPDQDALNYLFNQDVLLMDEKYNALVKDESLRGIENKIYHFAGAKKPWNNFCGLYTHLYCRYFAKTPWYDGDFLFHLYEQFDKKTKWLENFYQCVNNSKIVLFGAGYLGAKLVHKLNLSEEQAYFIDNNQKKWNEKIEGISIFSPEKLLKEEKKEKCKIIVALIIHYDEIKNWLIKAGYRENIEFFDGRKIIGMEIDWS